MEQHHEKFPRVSIITICFNAEQFVRPTLESVLGQTYPNLEYLVVDGGSRDSTPAIIREYESRIAWWVSEPDSGVSEAFNKGITKSTGEYLGFLNAGDYFYKPDALERFFESLQLPADIVYGRARLTFNPPINGISENITGSNKRPRHKLPTAHQAMLYHRSIWERFGAFRTDYRYSMDYEHYHRLRSRVTYSYSDVILAERPLSMARNSFGNPSRTYREYLRADIEHHNPAIFLNGIKYVRDIIKERWRKKG